MQHSLWPAVSGSLMVYAATLGCVLVSSVARAAPAAVAGFTYVKSLAGIDEYTLDANGLQVLIKPDHSAPVVTFPGDLSRGLKQRSDRHDRRDASPRAPHVQGQRGFQRSQGQQHQAVPGAVGAGFNATTSFDRTNYFATLGARSPGRLYRDRGGSDAAPVAARGGSPGRNDRGAQRIRAWRE